MIFIFLICLHVSLSCFPPSRPPRPPAPAPPPAPSPPPSSSCRCGEVRNSNKIVGGIQAAPNEFPWQVGLKSSRRQGTRPFCGGVLLDSRTVLTAAHCLTGRGSLYVVLGDYDVNRRDSGEVSYLVRSSNFRLHPSYNSRSQDYDFAIIRLSSSVTFTNSVKPVCMPNPQSNYDNRVARVTGWGTLSSGSSSQPSILREVDVNTMTNAACVWPNTIYSSSDVTRRMICASAPGKDACQGDSGGPLIARDGNSFKLIGVVSWGSGCAESNAPGVYSRVTEVLSWIQGQMIGSTCPAA